MNLYVSYIHKERSKGDPPYEIESRRLLCFICASKLAAKALTAFEEIVPQIVHMPMVCESCGHAIPMVE